MHIVVKLVVVVFFITGLPWLNFRLGLLIQLGLDCLRSRSFDGVLNRIVGNRIAIGLRIVLLGFFRFEATANAAA